MNRAVAAILFLGPAAAAAPQVPTQKALEYLSATLADDQKADAVLLTLRSTGDKDLAPILRAAARSGDKRRRLFGLLALADLLDKDAVEDLLDRLNNDPVMAIRAEALARLLELKAVTAEQLAAAIKIPDESVQCLAARELVQRGQVADALEMLRRLADSKDSGVAGLSQMCLLGLGQRDHEAPLRKIMRDPNAAPALLTVLLRQIEEQKIAAATALALEVAASEQQSPQLRARAYEAVSAVSSVGSVAVRDAIVNANAVVLQSQLLRVLADRPDAAQHLPAVVAAGGPIAALARFEQARQAAAQNAAQIVQEVTDLQHPVLVAYVIDRARHDIKAQGAKADFYTPALAKYLLSVDPRPSRLGKEHYLAAGAAGRLIELGTPAALAGLKAALSAKGEGIRRATSAGLLRTSNPAAAELVRPLLQSPYEDLATDAALVLGHLGDPAATEYLGGLLANPQRQPPALLVLASWYLLKIARQTQPAAAQLANLIK